MQAWQVAEPGSRARNPRRNRKAVICGGRGTAGLPYELTDYLANRGASDSADAFFAVMGGFPPACVLARLTLLFLPARARSAGLPRLYGVEKNSRLGVLPHE